MNITPISSMAGSGVAGMQPELDVAANANGRPGVKPADTKEVARQFEAILVKQMLAESMKGLIEGPKGQQGYGYFISEALADGITKAGGIGLRSILETQLGAQSAAQLAAQAKLRAGSDLSE
jgi:Rod binding domain-containing protein